MPGYLVLPVHRLLRLQTCQAIIRQAIAVAFECSVVRHHISAVCRNCFCAKACQLFLFRVCSLLSFYSYLWIRWHLQQVDAEGATSSAATSVVIFIIERLIFNYRWWGAGWAGTVVQPQQHWGCWWGRWKPVICRCTAVAIWSKWPRATSAVNVPVLWFRYYSGPCLYLLTDEASWAATVLPAKLLHSQFIPRIG